jgi:hypothetical protein
MEGKKRKKRSFLKRRLLPAVVILLAAVALGFFVVLPELVRRGYLNSTIEGALSDALGAEVRIDGAELTPASQVVVRNLRATHPGESSPFLTAEQFKIGGNIAAIASGNFAFLEAKGLRVRLAVKDGQLDWKLPKSPKKTDIPTFTLLDGVAEISVEGVPAKLRVEKMVINHIGGDLRTLVDGRVFLEGSPSPITINAGFLVDDLPGSLTLDISADGVALRPLGGFARLFGKDNLTVQDGTASLHATFDKGKGWADMTLSGLVLGGFGDDPARVDAALAVEYDSKKNILAISSNAANYIEVNGHERLEISPGSLVSFANGHIEVDAHCVAPRLDLADMLKTVSGLNNRLAKDVTAAGGLSARSIHIYGAPPELAAEMDCELNDASFTGFGATVEGVSGPMRITGSLDGPISARLDLRAQRASYSLDANTASKSNLAVSGAVLLSLSDMTLKADAALTLADGGRIACSGAVGLKDGSLKNVKVQSDGEIESGEIWSAVQALFLPEMAGWRIAGKAEAKALISRFAGSDGAPRFLITWDADLRGCEASAPVLAKPVPRLQGRVGAEVVIGAAFEEARNITIELSSPQFERISVSQGLYSAVGEGVYDIKCLVKTRDNESALNVMLANPPSGEFARELLKWDATAEMTLAGTGNEFTLSLKSLTLTNAPGRAASEPPRQVVLKNISGQFKKDGDALRMTASLPRLDAGRLWADTNFMFPVSYRTARIKGVLGLTCEAALKKDGSWATDVTVSASSLQPTSAFSYSSPDNSEQLDLGNTNVAVRLEKRAGGFSAAATVTLGGLYYYHTGTTDFTLDISESPVKISGSADLMDNGTILLVRDAALDIESIGEIALDGSALLERGGTVNAFVRITRLDSEALFQTLIVDNFSGAYDFLESLKVGGAITSRGLFFHGPLDALRVTGSVQLAGVGVSYKDFVVEGADADVPVDLYITGDGETSAAAREGVITFSRFSAGPAQVTSKRLPFRLAGNDMLFREGLKFDVPGGALSTREFSIRGVTLSQIRNHETRFLLSDITGEVDLAEMTETLGWTRMEGGVRVALTDIALRGEDMTSGGTITLSAFNGNVLFSRMSTDNMFHGPAKALFSADINDVSLSAISHTFGFGEISGTLRGKMTDFEYVLGTANGFEIDLEVVEGERQFVRPEFLRDFMFVNSGRILDLPQNVLVSLGTSRSYAYKEFGIHAILKNNILTLASPYKYQGQEAYMTAPWYGGVNIINENPGRQYRWKPIYTRISNVLSGKGQVKVNE